MTYRWWTYQKERFPILAHGPLIATFSFSTVCYSLMLRGQQSLPPAYAVLVAFATAFLFFLQLRIADEFKDREEDARYRPYRPVPRGLISLQELGAAGAAGAIIQLMLAALIAPVLIWLLVLVWLFLGLTINEFFVRDWLRSRPALYMWTHLVIMPLIDLYVSACDWLAAGEGPPRGLFWFLLVSFCSGAVLEIGRKIRAPEDEEPGVETYTVLWGRRNATMAWLGTLLLTLMGAWLAADQIHFAPPVVGLLVLLLMAAAAVVWGFLQHPSRQRAKLFDTMSGIWIFLLYLNLGAVPLLLRL